MDETVNRSTLVCPRCGSAAEEHPYCPKCGLHLFEEPELPTREMWERHVLTAAASFAQEAPESDVDAEPLARTISHSGPPGRGPFQSFGNWWQEQSRGGKAAFLISTVGAMMIGVVWVLSATVGGGSKDSSSSSGSTKSRVSAAEGVCVYGWNSEDNRGVRLSIGMGAYAEGTGTALVVFDSDDRCVISLPATPEERVSGLATFVDVEDGGWRPYTSNPPASQNAPPPDSDDPAFLNLKGRAATAEAVGQARRWEKEAAGSPNATLHGDGTITLAGDDAAQSAAARSPQADMPREPDNADARSVISISEIESRLKKRLRGAGVEILSCKGDHVIVDGDTVECEATRSGATAILQVTVHQEGDAVRLRIEAPK